MKSTSEQAVTWDEIVGHAAREWELKDLEGRPHALKDYRGKIVVLDFWYRNCIWCVRAMPQVLRSCQATSRAGRSPSWG